jgi:hypothetical protein
MATVVPKQNVSRIRGAVHDGKKWANRIETGWDTKNTHFDHSLLLGRLQRMQQLARPKVRTALSHCRRGALRRRARERTTGPQPMANQDGGPLESPFSSRWQRPQITSKIARTRRAFDEVDSRPSAPAIPDWISIWIAPHPRNERTLPASNVAGIDMYEFIVGGEIYVPSCNRLSVAGKNDMFIIDVVYHPGSTVTHPWDGHQTTARLHPNDSVTFDSTALVPLDPSEQSDWEATWGWRFPVFLESGFNPLVTPWDLTNEKGPWPSHATGGSSPSCLTGSSRAKP